MNYEEAKEKQSLYLKKGQFFLIRQDESDLYYYLIPATAASYDKENQIANHYAEQKVKPYLKLVKS